MDVMLVGAMRGVFLAIDKMGRSKGGNGGRIINVASAAGLTVIIVYVNVFPYIRVYVNVMYIIRMQG